MQTNRLQLVKFDINYATDLFELWSDYEVIKYTYMPLLSSIDECKAKIEMIMEHTDEEFTNNFVILLNKKAIGIIGCPVINKENNRYGLYYQLARSYWGNGYISEAAEAIMQYMKNKSPNVIINADAVSVNKSSLSILKRIGLTQTQIEKGGFTKNNLELDLIKFSTIL